MGDVFKVALGDSGSVYVSVDVDLFALTPHQRDLLFRLIDDVKALATTYAADAAEPPPSPALSPTVDKRGRRYSAVEKQAAVDAARRSGSPTAVARDLGMSVSVLRKWMAQADERASAGVEGYPPTWERDGKPGPAPGGIGFTLPPDYGEAVAAAKLERAEFVEQLDADEREVLAAALEREGVDLEALEAEGTPAYPDPGPIERSPVVEDRARASAAEALYEDR